MGARGSWSVVVALALAACGPKAPDGAPVGMSTTDGPALPTPERATHYAFDTIDDRPVSSAAHHGKPTVLAFVTTGDIVGQAQVGYLMAMAKNDEDRVNYALVALHPRREVVLVDAYREALGVGFPIALAEADATRADGPFGEIPAVPTVLVLDRTSHIVWKHTGLAKSEEIRAHLHGL